MSQKPAITCYFASMSGAHAPVIYNLTYEQRRSLYLLTWHKDSYYRIVYQVVQR